MGNTPSKTPPHRGVSTWTAQPQSQGQGQDHQQETPDAAQRRASAAAASADPPSSLPFDDFSSSQIPGRRHSVDGDHQRQLQQRRQQQQQQQQQLDERNRAEVQEWNLRAAMMAGEGERERQRSSSLSHGVPAKMYADEQYGRKEREGERERPVFERWAPEIERRTRELGIEDDMGEKINDGAREDVQPGHTKAVQVPITARSLANHNHHHSHSHHSHPHVHAHADDVDPITTHQHPLPTTTTTTTTPYPPYDPYPDPEPADAISPSGPPASSYYGILQRPPWMPLPIGDAEHAHPVDPVLAGHPSANMGSGEVEPDDLGPQAVIDESELATVPPLDEGPANAGVVEGEIGGYGTGRQGEEREEEEEEGGRDVDVDDEKRKLRGQRVPPEASGLGQLDAKEDEDELVDELEPYPRTGGEAVVPTTIEWRGKGENVFVTGTFVNWAQKFRLRPRDDDPSIKSVTLKLREGTHHLKFIVDTVMRASYHLPTAVDFTNHLVNYIEVVPPDTRAAATLPAAPVAPADSAATTPDTTAATTAAANTTTTLPLARRDFAPTKKSSSTTATTKATAVSQNTQRLESVRKAGTVSREEQGAVEDDDGVKGTGRPEPVYPPSAPTMVPVRSPEEVPDTASVPPPSAPLEPTRAEGYVGVAGQTIPTAPAPAPEQQQATYAPTEQAGEEEEEDEPAGDTRVIIPPLLEDVDVDEDCPTYRRAAQVISEMNAPPALPLFLGKSILNGHTPMKDDNSVLNYPNHTVLNHLATSSIKNGVLATSVTTRYKRKYVTTILYKPADVEPFD